MIEHFLKEELFNILRLLSSNDDLSQRQLANHLGFSLGKINYLLKSLAKRGLIELKNFSTKDNKSKKVRYFLTKKGLKYKIKLTYSYMKKKESEYNSLKGEWEYSRVESLSCFSLKADQPMTETKTGGQMRILRSYLVFVFSIFCVGTVFASNIFYEVNKGLERVGLKEILTMDRISLEKADFRLDPDFTLGYGDSVEVSFWGKIEANYNLQINRNGDIIIPFLGKLNIVGLTLNKANETIRKNLDKKYTNVDFDLTLTNVQNIRVTVLGNVKEPGPYTVNPFCRIAEVVARAGGPNDYGTLIDIKLRRDNKEVARFNIYDFVFKGDISQNVRLKHGDIVYISRAKNLIAIKGDVIYPGIYEIWSGTTLKDIIVMAGSIVSQKSKRKMYVLRIDPEKNTMREFIVAEFDSLEDIGKKYKDVIINNQDTVVVTTALDYNPYPQDLFWEVKVTGKVKLREFI